ncbi:MAG: asparagine synthase-related protein [Campylobacterota bacterium]|nr:asparagine synthase-related protein [Campylobacterota bacterium]
MKKDILNKYNINNQEIEIKSDLASEFPVYIYLSEKKDYLLYSTSIKQLLDSEEVNKPLKTTIEGISFLLQSGVVPLPNTVYQNIFIVSIGNTAKVKTVNNKIEIEFSYHFPFMNKDRDDEADIDEKFILETLAEATISRLEKDRDSYLFHSAGKDSNSIALALAEAGYQNQVTCISHQSKGDKDESEISQKIAKQLGFKHQKLYDPKELNEKYLYSINTFFENAPFPSMDGVTLAYPLYATQINFDGTNLIDGMGNDTFIGHIPSKLEFERQRKLSRYHNLRPFVDKLDSYGRVKVATNTRSEWTGLFGISYRDTSKILKNSYNAYSYWKNIDVERNNFDYLDFRASLRGTLIDQEIFTRKIRNFADITNSNLILPWTNQKVAQYFSKLPERYLFDRKELKNKLILRKILKNKIGLDSDKLGKMAYSFDFYAILMMMKDYVDNQILFCKLWNNIEIKKLLNSFYHKIDSNHRLSWRYKTLVQRLYLISVWYNTNKYVNN